MPTLYSSGWTYQTGGKPRSMCPPLVCGISKKRSVEDAVAPNLNQPPALNQHEMLLLSVGAQ